MRKSACFISQLSHAGKMPLWYRHHSHILCWDCKPLQNIWEKKLWQGWLPSARPTASESTGVPPSGFFPKGKSQISKQSKQNQIEIKQTSSLLARSSVVGKHRDGLCSNWLAGVHSKQFSWEDFCCWYLILLPLMSMKIPLLTIHSTGTGRDAGNKDTGTFSCYEVTRIKRAMFSFASRQQNRMPLTRRQFAKENPSGVLQLQEHKHLFVHDHTLLCLFKMHQSFTKTTQKRNL